MCEFKEVITKLWIKWNILIYIGICQYFYAFSKVKWFKLPYSRQLSALSYLVAYMASPVLLVYRAARLFNNSNIRIPKHHLWIFSRPYITSQILNRGKALHRMQKKSGSLENKVWPSLNNSEVSIVYLLYISSFVHSKLIDIFRLWICR